MLDPLCAKFFIENIKMYLQSISFPHTDNNATTVTECKSYFNLTTDTPYLALLGELWDVYFEDLGENWLCFNGTALYVEL